MTTSPGALPSGIQFARVSGRFYFLGILLSLGSTSAVATVVVGVVLAHMSPFRVGDRVRITDTTGDIVASNLLIVTHSNDQKEEITIPNASVSNNHIVNYSALATSGGLILHKTVTNGYDVPWLRVHELLLAAAGRIEGVLADPKPFVLQTSLGDLAVSYELNAHTDKPNPMAHLYSDVHRGIQEEFAGANVEILSPHYVASRDGNATTVPTDEPPASLSSSPGSPPDPVQFAVGSRHRVGAPRRIERH